MSNLRIRSVKFKNGGEIRMMPAERGNFSRVNLGWGEVVFRAYDGEELKRRDLAYMCDCAKHVVMTGEVE